MRVRTRVRFLEGERVSFSLRKSEGGGKRSIKRLLRKVLPTKPVDGLTPSDLTSQDSQESDSRLESQVAHAEEFVTGSDGYEVPSTLSGGITPVGTNSRDHRGGGSRLDVRVEQEEKVTTGCFPSLKKMNRKGGGFLGGVAVGALTIGTAAPAIAFALEKRDARILELERQVRKLNLEITELQLKHVEVDLQYLHSLSDTFKEVLCFADKYLKLLEMLSAQAALQTKLLLQVAHTVKALCSLLAEATLAAVNILAYAATAGFSLSSNLLIYLTSFVAQAIHSFLSLHMVLLPSAFEAGFQAASAIYSEVLGVIIDTLSTVISVQNTVILAQNGLIVLQNAEIVTLKTLTLMQQVQMLVQKMQLAAIDSLVHKIAISIQHYGVSVESEGSTLMKLQGLLANVQEDLPDIFGGAIEKAVTIAKEVYTGESTVEAMEVFSQSGQHAATEFSNFLSKVIQGYVGGKHDIAELIREQSQLLPEKLRRVLTSEQDNPLLDLLEKFLSGSSLSEEDFLFFSKLRDHCTTCTSGEAALQVSQYVVAPSSTTAAAADVVVASTSPIATVIPSTTLTMAKVLAFGEKALEAASTVLNIIALI